MGKVAIVNKHDQVIGELEKMEAINKGQIRRIVRIFLFDKQNRLYLQKRGPNVETYPNTWDQSAGGHTDLGEDYEQAAYRELEEELNVTKAKLQYLGKCYFEGNYRGIITKEFTVTYKAIYDGTITIDQSEVSAGKWFTLKTVDQMVNKNPQQFPKGFIHIFKKYRNDFLSGLEMS